MVSTANTAISPGAPKGATRVSTPVAPALRPLVDIYESYARATARVAEGVLALERMMQGNEPRMDRQADRDDDAELRAYNDRLAAMARRARPTNSRSRATATWSRRRSGP